jgi:hypothetical protein
VALILILALGLASLALLGVLVVGLFRHVKVLGRSLQQFNEELTPLLKRMREGSLAAQDTADSIAERRSRRGAGARLRR